MARDRAGRYLPVDILDLLLKRDAQLWIVWDDGVVAAIVTQIVVYPRLKELHILGIGGIDRKSWHDDAEAVLANFAKEKGCKVMASGGRRGWLRVLNPIWKETGATWEREVAQ